MAFKPHSPLQSGLSDYRHVVVFEALTSNSVSIIQIWVSDSKLTFNVSRLYC